ncbi:kinase-like domain-containing protein [Daldinia sp. FL1419]|nr:kinase-like domain-containing protein [Daldinia sp. FL1419]
MEGKDVPVREIDMSKGQLYRHPLHPHEDLEDIELYRPGGYHPVEIGNVLHGRYEVVHKLGHGDFSTVWMCLDITGQKWKAVKILAACRSSTDCPELKLRQIVGASQLVTFPERHFWISGINGKHLALVSPLLGPTISNTSSLTSNVNKIKRVCWRLAEALEYIHSRNICHGDLKPQNVLHRMHSIDSLTKEQLWELLGSPFSSERRYPITTVDGNDPGPHAPSHATYSVNMCGLQDWVIKDDITLIDFGEAFEDSMVPSNPYVPLSHVSPEILAKSSPSLSSDVWSLAYSILEIWTRHKPQCTVEGAIASMELLLGPLPEEYRQMLYDKYLRDPDPNEEVGSDNPKIERSTTPVNSDFAGTYLIWDSEELQEQRKIAQQTHKYNDLLNAKIGSRKNLGGFGASKERTYRMPRREVLQLSDLLRRMLRYDPKLRLSAKGVLDHPWFGAYRTSESGSILESGQQTLEESGSANSLYGVES